VSTRSPNPGVAGRLATSLPDHGTASGQPNLSIPGNGPTAAASRFGGQLASVLESSKSKPALLRAVAAMLTGIGARGLWVVSRNQASEWSSPISLSGDDNVIQDALDNSLTAVIQQLHDNPSLAVQEPPTLPGYVLLGTAVLSSDEVTDWLICLFPSANATPVPFDWAVGMVGESISRWQLQHFVRSTRYQLASLSSFVNLSAAVNRTENRLEAAITLVNELKSATRTGHVALLLQNSRSGPFRLAAMSGVEFFDRNAATTQTIESTVVGIPEEPAFWYRPTGPSGTPGAEHNANLRNFCQLFEAAGCALLPLRDRQESLFGWLLLTLSPDQCGQEQTERHFRQISGLVAGQMDTVLKSQRSLLRTGLDNARQTLRSKPLRKLAVMAAVAGFILCLPFSYRIPCDCRLQLTSRRFVAAPYEGLLEKTLVSTGDVVAEGQTLARMDASQLRMQLSGLQANLESERKKRDSALARGNVAESQIARSEMGRLQSEICIISERLDNTEIRSPIAGVVVSGDLDKAQGAPMEMGQNLFEVGPLEQILAEILIPERDIQHARPGMAVKFEFDAFPFETFTGTIRRIHPRAELVDNESVFVAEIDLENTSGQLRPGLQGRAKILGDRHPLAWNWFHGPFEQARQWLIW
jgi:hypothetical protein